MHGYSISGPWYANRAERREARRALRKKGSPRRQPRWLI